MRCLRGLRARKAGGQPHVRRPLRPAAPGPGVGRHGGERRRHRHRRQGHGPGRHRLRRAHPLGPARAISPSATPGTRRTGPRTGPAPSPSTGRWGGPASRSGTTATSPTPRALAEKVGMLPGSIATDSDVVAELLAHVLPRDRGPLHRAAAGAARSSRARSRFVLMSSERLFGVRDPYGFRPLCLGRLGPADAPEGWVLASETPALSVIGATFVREVAPGELVVIDADGPTSLEVPWLREVEPRLCIFEFAYIARPDSRLYGREVHETRCRMGELLAAQAPAEADMVMGVPESGVPGRRGLRPGQRHPLRAGPGEEPLHRPLLHRARPAGAGRRRAAQAEPARRRHRRQAAGGGGRLHRARDDAALGHPHAARGRRGRGPPAHLVAAVALALLLRDRHAVVRGAAGDRPHRRGDGRDPRAPTRWPTSASRT